MKKKLNINILTWQRSHFLELTFYFLKKMKPENKEQIHVSILCYGNPAAWNPAVADLAAHGVEASAVSFEGKEYLDKIRWAVEQDYEYSAKTDEDVIASNHVYDFCVENIDILQRDDTVSFMPLISNGIPTTDYFINQFFNDEERAIMHKTFLNTTLGELCGVDYSVLNKHTVGAQAWDSEAFFKSVSEINHYFKGMHPIRMSAESQFQILDLLLNNVDKYQAKHDYSFFEMKEPYVCNGFNFIKTKEWKTIMDDRSLVLDAFDEVALNQYRHRSGKKIHLINNGFIIHFAYNTIYWHPQAKAKQEWFYQELKKKVIGNVV